MKRIFKTLLSLASLCFLVGLVLISASAKVYTRPQAPKMRAVSNVKHGLYVSWSRVDNAEGYIVYRKKSGSENWKKLDEVKGRKNSYIDKTVKNTVKYKYVVKAFNGKLKSSQSPNPKSKTYVAVPKIKAVKNVQNGIHLRFERSKNLSSVCVYRRVQDSENWKKIATLPGDSNSYTDSRVKSGEKYSYQVRRVVGRAMSAKNANIVTNRFVAVPERLVAKGKLDSVLLSWKSVPGANGYRIFRKTYGGSWKQTGTVRTNSFLDKNAPVGDYVFYKVCAFIDSKYVSALSKSSFAKLIDPKKPMVALTYDDGPYRPVTNQILDVLEKYGARATFFVVGSRVSTYSDCIRRANSLGCQIGNHTYNHKTLTEASDSQVKSEISATNAVIKRCIGKNASIVRAPGGSTSGRVRSLVEYPFINWSVDTLDWKHRNTAKVIASVKSDVTDGSIVLMHDLYSSTGNASEVIVPWLINQGYQLVTVSEMMYYKGIKMTKGNVYSHA